MRALLRWLIILTFQFCLWRHRAIPDLILIAAVAAFSIAWCVRIRSAFAQSSFEIITVVIRNIINARKLECFNCEVRCSAVLTVNCWGWLRVKLRQLSVSKDAASENQH